MDIIFLDDVRLSTWIGVYDWERQAPQTVELSLEIGLPDRDAGHSDDLADTIDYEAVLKRLQADLAQLLEIARPAVLARVVRAHPAGAIGFRPGAAAEALSRAPSAP